MEFLKRTWIDISLDHLAYNYETLRGRLSPSTKFMGIVKADAYGHGAVMISHTLEELGAEYLAVSNLEEAWQLRNGGVRLPILILGHVPAKFAETEADSGIRQEVNDVEYARELNEALRGSGKRLKVHIKLDTGMSRLGFFAYGRLKTLDEITEISSMEHLEIEGIFQHFCAADSTEPDAQDFTALQFRRFTAMLENLAAAGIRPALRHCCNSAAMLLRPEYQLDMVRPGIVLYGHLPDPSLAGTVNLRPVLSWRAAIAQIRTFPAGIPISYGRTWTTPKESRIAVLPVGYADGLSRSLSNRVSFLLNGRPVPQVGRICMDMCMLDVTDFPEARVDDAVTILGTDGERTCSCEDMAEKTGTISYEILCNISKRVPRVFYRNGEKAGTLRYIV